jgi:SAM-dependent methyltransferase
VLDILPGENVDVVGDAHALGDLFPPERFDAFYSVSVFEHLLMPWAVVPQINRVLKPGGIGLIHTHQTLGMHDLPWDFWRFSDTAWDALFNSETGFEIVDRCLDSEQFILPFIYRPSKRYAELSAGFEGSSVWVKKIGPCKLRWDVVPSDLVKTSYPNEDDHFVPDGF